MAERPGATRVAPGLRWTALITVLIGLTLPSRTVHGQSRASASAPLVIGYLVPSGDTALARAYHRGVQMGIREAMRAGELLGRDVGYVELAADPGRFVPPEDSRARGVRAVVAPGIDEANIASLGEWASRTRIPVIVIGPVGEARCVPFVFRIAPPQSVDAGALLAHQVHADSAVNGASDRSGMRIGFWHPSLERFGAAQLSDRFRAQYGAAMTSDAWAGWMAVKILWESALRADTTADGLRNAIGRSGFDGHKGRALRFGHDNVLRQPLMIVKSGTPAGAPDRLVAEVDWPEAPGDRDATTGTSDNAAAACGGAS